jgi:hypothetical protein
MKVIKADDYILAILGKGNRELAAYLKADVLVIKSPILAGLDTVIRNEIESIGDKPQPPKRPNRLCVLIETTGGYIEVVERIYSVFRKHYRYVNFIVPNFAYSAGTVLVLSGDEIYMDYYSILGPIDPQYDMGDGKFLPGLGYLNKYNELVDIVNNAPDPKKVRAQLAYLLDKFEPAVLFFLEQARNHSISLLEEWLPRHKFRHWKVTRTGRTKVTPTMRRQRAKEIATVLGDPTRWHSHGRGIGIRELTSDEIKLNIINYGETPALRTMIGNYYHLFADYCVKMGAGGTENTVIHSLNGLRRF